MPRDNKQSQDREFEGNAELDRERDPPEADGDDLDRRAEEARELDRNPMKHEEYQKDVEAELDDLEDMEGPDA